MCVCTYVYILCIVYVCIIFYQLHTFLQNSPKLKRLDTYLFLHIYLFSVFHDKSSLCSSGSLGTRSVDQAGLDLRYPPASASQLLGIKSCATTVLLKA